MKLVPAFLILVLIGQVTFGQDIVASTGSFGENITKKGAVSAEKLPGKMESKDSLEVKVKGRIVEVCQNKGCWMTLDMGNNEVLRVRFKDYGFFVPKDAAGKTAIIDGQAIRRIVSVDELQHQAEDAGKSEEEIEAITEPAVALTYMAKGVIIQ